MKKDIRKPIFDAVLNRLIGELFKGSHQNRYSFLDMRENGRHGVWVSSLGESAGHEFYFI